MISDSRVSQEDRLAPEEERCELILWIEADWRCEYWLLGESGLMRLYSGPDTILEARVTDAIVALRDAQTWHDVVLHGAWHRA
jgi:hypothetical protein